MKSLRLKLDSLSAGFRTRTVLENVSMEIFYGELLAIVGPNGAGKTTLLRTIAGIAQPLAGSVELDGHSVASFEPRERARRIAYLRQGTDAPWPYSVRELVFQGRYPHRGWFGRGEEADRAAVERALDRAGLAGYEDRPITELSGGELQRAMIARALAQEPAVLLLDEPVSSLDVRHQAKALDIVRDLADEGMAVVASLHDLNLAGLYADRIAVLSEGRLFALGTPKEVLREDLIREAFLAEISIADHPELIGTPLVLHPAPKRRKDR